MSEEKIGVHGGRASLGAPALGVNPPKPDDQNSNPKKVEHDGNDDKDQDQQNDQDAS